MKPSRAVALSALLVPAVPAPGTPALLALSRQPTSLVQVAPSPRAAALMRRSGGTIVSRNLRIWKVRSGTAQQLVARLHGTGTLTVVEPNGARRTLAVRHDGDPLLPSEWWTSAIGVDTLTPPGPGRPVTDVDNGLDLTHPEFAARPDTTALDAQTTDGDKEWHGTAVGSIVAAPANGIGVVGVYPAADFRAWDASPHSEITYADEIRGILAAAEHGPTVINLSLGAEAYSALEEQAILRAYGSGSLVVAAAGNSGDQGNSAVYPADLPHVLTVGAADRTGRAAAFSSFAPAVDLVAPGVEMPFAVPLWKDPTGFGVFDGTSFSAPLVSGAAAWVATLRPQLTVSQLFQTMRRSARDAGPAGYDAKTGYGQLDVPASLAYPAPPDDPQEPNEDVVAVRAHGLFADAKPPLVTAAKPAASVRGTMDFTEDPEDIYRIVVPPGKTVTVTARPTGRISLALWGPRTTSVRDETGMALARDLLATSRRPGTATERVVHANRRRSAVTLYVDLWIPRGLRVRDLSYSLRISAR